MTPCPITPGPRLMRVHLVQNSKAKKEDFGPHGHLTDYLPTLRGQSWTFD